MFPVLGGTGGRLLEFLVGCLQAKVTVVHLRCGLYYFKNVQKSVEETLLCKIYNFSAYLTLAAVPAGELVALVHHPLLAVPAREADGTGAGVVLPSVEAGRPVVTGLVVGAEVEVLVTHLASPAFRALTRPGLGAGSVDTAGVDLAVLTQGALPALVTSGREKTLE